MTKSQKGLTKSHVSEVLREAEKLGWLKSSWLTTTKPDGRFKMKKIWSWK